MIHSLYKQLEKAIAAYDAIQSLPVEDAAANERDEEFRRAIAKADAIGKRIANAPANDIDEMLIKIRVAIWAMGVRYKKLEDLDNLKPDLDDSLEDCAMLTLRDDLQRLKAAA